MVCFSASASDPVPAGRLPYGGTWEGIVGVDGGIPNRTTVFTNFYTTNTLAQINGGIAACPSNQVVQFESGTFTNIGTGNLVIGVSGVTLRGATNASGLPTTIFDFAGSASGISMSSDDYWWFDAGIETTLYTECIVTNGTTRGSTTVTLSNTPAGLTVGNLIFFGCGTNDAIMGAGDWSALFGKYPYSQMAKVTAINGRDVSFTPPINADYLTNSTSGMYYKDDFKQVSRSGIENIKFQVQTGTNYFSNSVFDGGGLDSCWLLNCSFKGLDPGASLNAIINITLCFRFEMRRCDLSEASENGSATYCLSTCHCSNLLIEDNIFHDIANCWPLIPTAASAFSYNLFINEVYQSDVFLSQIVFFHGSHSHFNLFEGNYIPSHYNDAITDGNKTHSANSTYLRERLLGWDIYPSPGGKEQNLHPFTFRDHHDNVSIAGCVLGTAGKQTVYARTTADTGVPFAIYNAEPNTTNTMVRKGNYNTVDGAVPAAEALTGGEAIVNSYLHASKPSWFGNRPWPWVDPANFTQSDALTNFPAGYRYTFESDPPAGGVTASASVTGGTFSGATFR